MNSYYENIVDEPFSQTDYDSTTLGTGFVEIIEGGFLVYELVDITSAGLGAGTVLPVTPFIKFERTETDCEIKVELSLTQKRIRDLDNDEISENLAQEAIDAGEYGPAFLTMDPLSQDPFNYDEKHDFQENMLLIISSWMGDQGDSSD